ncbi:hypothetical protein DFH27DRAFT_524219 [Peziza echinospora]|nr:hypothetical protein DFH27DRAFT_524219 [Peziza echinospora]
MSKPETQIGSTEWERKYTMRYLEERLARATAQAAPIEASASAEHQSSGSNTNENRNRAVRQGRATAGHEQGIGPRPMHRTIARLRREHEAARASIINYQIPRQIYWGQGEHFVGAVEERDVAEEAEMVQIIAIQGEVEGREGERRTLQGWSVGGWL